MQRRCNDAWNVYASTSNGTSRRRPKGYWKGLGRLLRDASPPLLEEEVAIGTDAYLDACRAGPYKLIVPVLCIPRLTAAGRAVLEALARKGVQGGATGRGAQGAVGDVRDVKTEGGDCAAGGRAGAGTAGTAGTVGTVGTAGNALNAGDVGDVLMHSLSLVDDADMVDPDDGSAGRVEFSATKQPFAGRNDGRTSQYMAEAAHKLYGSGDSRGKVDWRQYRDASRKRSAAASGVGGGDGKKGGGGGQGGKRQYGGERKCFNCGKVGHRKRNCPGVG